jgi:hypothetical protein
MTIEALYPTVRPTLNLNFARTKALDPRVTFTRASTGTFVGSNGLIQTAASGAARFDHDPETGESLGLLVEEARTNSQTYSQDFADASWLKLATVVPNAGLAPDGTSTASLVYPYSFGSSQYVYRSATSTSAIRTNVIYAKASGKSWLYLFDPTNTVPVYFNLATGTLGTVASGVSATISSAGNGWYRCSATNNTASTFANFFFAPCNADNDRYSSASGTDGILVWGAQQETGSFPTSYIPTTSATVTRAADVASMTGTNFSSWYNNNQGTYFLNAVTLNGSTATNTTQDNLIDDGYVYIQDYVGASVRRRVIASASGAFNFNPAQAPSRRVAVAFDSSSANVAYNGILQSVDTTVSGLPNTASSLRIGATITSAALVDQGYITRLAYYPVRLPDAQLQELTK